MVKYISIVLLAALLTTCASDPLSVDTKNIQETVTDDGLTAIDLANLPEGWTETDGVVTATAPATLELLPEHGPLTLSMSFKTDPGTRAILELEGKYAVAIPALTLPGGGEPVDGMNVSPGIWQDLEIAYQPATDRSPALIAAVYLNGNLAHYQQVLPASNAEGGPLQITLQEGTLSLSNLRTRDRAGKSSSMNADGSVELSLPLIHYTYYHVDDNPDDVQLWGNMEPVKDGYISRFDINNIRDRGQGWAARFDAEFDVPKAGEYTFSLWSPSSSRLYIDDQLVVDLGGRTQESYLEGEIELSAGAHEIRIDHYQYGGWNRLDVGYSESGGTQRGLNDMRDGGRPLNTPSIGKVTELETDDRPYLLRSFLNFPPVRVYEETDKRTHVVNVGEGQGPHYSYDLQNGSLLLAWRGKFVNVNDLWEGRGEPQVARPLGNTLVFDGRSQWATSSGSWPDSAEYVHHLRYELDGNGRPTFYFEVDGSEVSDEILPTDAGLTRTLKNTGGKELYTQLAAANHIAETAPGSFELRGPGGKLNVGDYPAGGLTLLRSEAGDRLVASMPAGGTITYNLNW